MKIGLSKLEDRFRQACGTKNFRMLLPAPAGTSYQSSPSEYTLCLSFGDKDIEWKSLAMMSPSLASGGRGWNRFGKFARLLRNGQSTASIEVDYGQPVTPADPKSFVLKAKNEEVPYDGPREAWLGMFEILAGKNSEMMTREADRMDRALALAQSHDVVYDDGLWREILFSNDDFLLLRNPFPDVPGAEEEITLLHHSLTSSEYRLMADKASRLLVPDGSGFVMEDENEIVVARFERLSDAIYSLVTHPSQRWTSSGHERLRLLEAAERLKEESSICESLPDFWRLCRSMRKAPSQLGTHKEKR